MKSWRSIRSFWWWLGLFAKKQQKLILGTSLIVALLALLVKNTLPLLPRFKPTQKVGIVGQYTVNTLPMSFSGKLGRGLFRLTETGEVEPDLALDWQLSDNESVYTVRLKAGEQWNDSTPLVAREIIFDLPGVSMAYPDDSTIEFTLAQPYSPFLQLLAKPVFKDKFIGSGEQSVKSVDLQGQFLKRLRLSDEAGDYDYRFYPSHQAAWLGFRLGEVDRLENFLINPLDSSWQDKVRLTANSNLHTYIGLLFNLENGTVASKSLRQALAYAIKTKAPEGTVRALSPLSPNSWAYSDEVKPYDFNPEQAQELFDKFLEESNQEAELSLTLGTSVSFLGFAEEVSRSWEEVLGIEVNVKTVNSIEPDWQIILAAQEIPEDPDQHQLWHSTQETNLTNYSDLKVDKLLEDGRQISDRDTRVEIYRDFQRFIAEDLPVIFLYHPVTYTISRQ